MNSRSGYFWVERASSVNHFWLSGKRLCIVASYGKSNDPGQSPSTATEIDGPYSAYLIGDYPGLTPPF